MLQGRELEPSLPVQYWEDLQRLLAVTHPVYSDFVTVLSWLPLSTGGRFEFHIAFWGTVIERFSSGLISTFIGIKQTTLLNAHFESKTNPIS